MPFEIEPRPATATELEAVRIRLAALEETSEEHDVALLSLENSADETATAIQAHEARITALEQPVVVPPPPPPARLVGPVYYLPRDRFDFAKANGISVAQDWVPQAIGKFDDLAARGMRCDIELAAHAGSSGGADTVAEVRAWLQQALGHPKAQQVVRRILLADEVDAFYPHATPAFLRPLYAECKAVAPMWPVAVLVIAHGAYWNQGKTQPYLANDVCDVVQIDHYVHDYPARPVAAICQQIEDVVRKVRTFIGPTKPINFVCQAFDPNWGTPALTLPTPEALRDMGLAALRGGANDVGLWTDGQYANTLWPNIGIAAQAWR